VSQGSRTRVLVVDDEPSVLLEISGALKRHYDVVTARSAEEAEALARKLRKDCRELPDPQPLAIFDEVYADMPPYLQRQRDTFAGYLSSFAEEGV